MECYHNLLHCQEERGLVAYKQFSKNIFKRYTNLDSDLSMISVACEGGFCFLCGVFVLVRLEAVWSTSFLLIMRVRPSGCLWPGGGVGGL